VPRSNRRGVATPPAPGSRLEFLPDTLYVSGIPLNFADVGHGPTVVLLHSAAASHRQWLELIGLLAPRYRVIAPDLPGHGATPALAEGGRRADLVQVVQALTEMIGGPFHLVGHSVGASIALQGALAWHDRLLSLTLAEPASFELLRQEGDSGAWREIERLAARHVSLARLGEPEWAADFFMDYWIGRPAWGAMPPHRREAVRKTMSSVAIGWEDNNLESPCLADFVKVTVPTLLLRAKETTPAARAVVELLHRVLPRHELVEIAGAGHMAPLTHPQPVNRAILRHLELHTPCTEPECEEAVA
jgi:pimeloyl-ACP methyl ester carboxylesterase